MNENSVVSLRPKGAIDDPLTEILRSGARRLISQAVEAEFEAFLASNAELVLPDGRQRVVRHGHDPVRALQTGIGPVEVQKPKARDRGATPGARIRFTSNILPKWARRTKSLDALLPVLYLRGISAGDFQEALAALLGKDAPNLSAAVIARLKSEWEDEYRQWQDRDLSARHYVYVWADGVYLQARMEPQAECMLMLMGATPEGKKELIGFQTGMRECSKLEGTARRFEGARPVGGAASGHWRWRARLLESSRRGVPDDAPSAMLAAQDIERSRQVPEVDATQRAQGPARDMAVAGPGCGGGGDDDIRREIRAQIRQGRRMPDQGSPDAADVLRLSRRSLGPLAHIEPHRKRLRDGEASHRPHEGRSVTGHSTSHGLQAGDGGLQDLASIERSKPVAESHQRCKIQRRNRRRR
jgi:putative transposase